jgi:hypothetical protein
MVLNLPPIFSCDFPPIAPLVSGENDPFHQSSISG